MNDSESQKSWGDESSQSDWTESLEAKDQQKVIYTDLFEKYERHKQVMLNHSSKLKAQMMYSMLQNNSLNNNLIDYVDSSDLIKLPTFTLEDDIDMISYGSETPIPEKYKMQITFGKENTFFFHFESQLKTINRINCEMLKLSQIQYKLVIAKDDIKTNLYCSVFYNHFWYRCRVIEKSDELAQVFLIDYGDIIEVSLNSLRLLLKEFANFPRQANKCVFMEPCPLDVSDLQYLFEANVYRLIDFVFFLDLTTRINKNEHNIKQILLDYTHENNDEEW